jgi:ComF family protein
VSGRWAGMSRIGLALVRTALVALVSRPHCSACDAPIATRTIFCSACSATVVPLPEPAALGGTRGGAAPPGADVAARPVSPFVYGGAVAELVTRFKYAPAPHLAGPAYALLQRSLASLSPIVAGGSPWVVCPVPLHPRRLAERGFNQAALIARPLALALGVHFAPRLLRRSRDTPRQASLDRRARLANVESAFSLGVGRWASGHHVLLVDDVVTTGATLRACAAALGAGGALSVRSVAIATSLAEGAAGVAAVAGASSPVGSSCRYS